MYFLTIILILAISSSSSVFWQLSTCNFNCLIVYSTQKLKACCRSTSGRNLSLVNIMLVV